jgi:anthranilate phosphoribosyltransferase
MNIQQALNHITKNIHLTQPQMEDVMRSIMQGEATDAQIGALMMGLRMKGESIDEMTAAARVMREFAIKIDVSDIHIWLILWVQVVMDKIYLMSLQHLVCDCCSWCNHCKTW